MLSACVYFFIILKNKEIITIKINNKFYNLIVDSFYLFCN